MHFPNRFDEFNADLTALNNIHNAIIWVHIKQAVAKVLHCYELDVGLSPLFVYFYNSITLPFFHHLIEKIILYLIELLSLYSNPLVDLQTSQLTGANSSQEDFSETTFIYLATNVV